jgi:cellulose synthase (UDP-forming)
VGDLLTWAPVLVAAGSLYALMQVRGWGSHVVRATCSVVAIALALRYLWWRYAMSLPDPADQSLLQTTWTWLFLITETVAAVTSMSVLAWMSRWRNRSAEADRTAGSPLHMAPVDVFIATLNEPFDILERTIVSATCIDHHDLRVWVLDDGARPWVRQLAEELGVQYVSRRNGQHAKAGNINNGLAIALATGRRPEFILLLDADFTVSRNILRRTLGLFEELDVGIVQTPQHFFNPDPVQNNLLCTKVWPDEQRFFFNYMLEAKDAWGVAFCCGTSAVVRVTALEAIGGMATETVTEDMLTTFKLKERGFRTIFLNEQLSMGLAPEGLQEYIKQRSRWCLGCMQQIYTRWSFLGAARVGIANRLSCLGSACYWMFTFPFKIMLITAPLVYWWTGTAVINANAEDIVYWLGPAIAASLLFMATYGGNRVFPVMTDVSQLLSAFAIVGTVAVAIVQPWGHPFKVTAKGRVTDSATVQWRIAIPFGLMAIATMLGMLSNLSSYSPLKIMPGYTLNVIWSVGSIAVLLLAAQVCVEPPRYRLDERFPADEPALLSTTGAGERTCIVRDLSVGGASLTCSDGWSDVLPGQLMFLQDGTTVRFRPIRLNDGELAVRFDDSAQSRRRMTAKLFTGRYHNEIEHVSAWKLLRTTVRSLLS